MSELGSEQCIGLRLALELDRLPAIADLGELLGEAADAERPPDMGLGGAEPLGLGLGGPDLIFALVIGMFACSKAATTQARSTMVWSSSWVVVRHSAE